MLSRALPPLDTTGRAERRSVAALLAGLVVAGVLLAGAFAAGQLLLQVTSDQWLAIGAGLLATLLRVAVALALALLWTVPLGVVIGTNRRVAAVLQPVVQLIASVPATALFPLLLLALLTAPGGLNIAAVLLMLLGTQWYVLFNVIAGASAIPQDLRYTSALLQLRGWTRWRTLVLPALFPYLITGMITASGGAWNASIVAEYVVFGGQTYAVTGVGTEIAQATAAGDYPLLLAATLGMIVAVVVLNRVVWRRLYRLAESTYRLE
jgi:NitT/TauT family transport system permease protein